MTSDDPIEVITVQDFEKWLRREPQCLVWLPVLHRLAWAELAKHNVKCRACKTYPLIGFRYHCLKCFNFDLCHNCFFLGRGAKGHKNDHPMKEYCTSTGTSVNFKNWTSSVRNSFRTKKYFKKKSEKLGYLPVSSVLEGEDYNNPISPDLSVEDSESHRMSKEVVSPTATANKTIDDEHALIAKYCQILYSNSDSSSTTPTDLNSDENTSPMLILRQFDQYQKQDLERLIATLEDENKQLNQEYKDLLADNDEGDVEKEVKQESRQCKRMEKRMKMLEDHNRQLDAQLQRLRQLLSHPTSNGTLTSRSVVAAELHTASFNGDNQMDEMRKPPQSDSLTSGNNFVYIQEIHYAPKNVARYEFWSFFSLVYDYTFVIEKNMNLQHFMVHSVHHLLCLLSGNGDRNLESPDSLNLSQHETTVVSD